jgi:hypothetical protein
MIFPLRVLGRSVTMYYGSAGFGVEGESGECDVYRVGDGKVRWFKKESDDAEVDFSVEK